MVEAAVIRREGDVLAIGNDTIRTHGRSQALECRARHFDRSSRGRLSRPGRRRARLGLSWFSLARVSLARIRRARIRQTRSGLHDFRPPLAVGWQPGISQTRDMSRGPEPERLRDRTKVAD